ncbi:redoxin domain-containing protein [Runella sp. CRIBMP]|uniref:thioredoxin family protein n=1 Tax=Runella sp. CRIBMP TaxID=2683261 RepID=UPI0014133DC0|nr:thioredoxin family protein [Runella sp. CRIBMP]NBB22673.1 redoxin domain-containing protein [Runella sp. CRIBMP]
MKKKFWVPFIITLTLGTLVSAALRKESTQTPPAGYPIGGTVADFKLKNVDGNVVSLSNYKDKKGVIVVFTSNHCPFSKAYEERIIGLDKKYAAQGFPVLAINSNDAGDYEENSFDNMKKRAQEKGFTFPYLQDETQGVAKAFGATRTPHVFILRNDGGKFTVQYIGTIDDNYQDPAGVTKRYVEDAVSNILMGKPVVVTQTKAVGCAIGWKDA